MLVHFYRAARRAVVEAHVRTLVALVPEWEEGSARQPSVGISAIGPRLKVRPIYWSPGDQRLAYVKNIKEDPRVQVRVVEKGAGNGF